MGINILTEEHLEKIKKDEHVKGYNKGYAKAKLVGEQNLQAYIDKKKAQGPYKVTLDQISDLSDTFQKQTHKIIYRVLSMGMGQHRFYLEDDPNVTSTHMDMHIAFAMINSVVHAKYTKAGIQPYSVTLNMSFREWLAQDKDNLEVTVDAPAGKPKEEDVVPKANIKGNYSKDTLTLYNSAKVMTIGHMFYSPGSFPISFEADDPHVGFAQLHNNIYNAYKKAGIHLNTVQLDTSYEKWLKNGKPIITAMVSYSPEV